MVGAPALDQGDRPRQRRAASGTQFSGQGPCVGENLLCNHALLYNGRAGQARARARRQRGVAAADAVARGFSRRRSQTSTGQTDAPMAMDARITATGRSKKGGILPSDLISDVTKACSTIVSITMPSTMAATG